MTSCKSIQYVWLLLLIPVGARGLAWITPPTETLGGVTMTVESCGAGASYSFMSFDSPGPNPNVYGGASQAGNTFVQNTANGFPANSLGRYWQAFCVRSDFSFGFSPVYPDISGDGMSWGPPLMNGLHTIESVEPGELEVTSFASYGDPFGESTPVEISICYENESASPKTWSTCTPFQTGLVAIIEGLSGTVCVRQKERDSVGNTTALSAIGPGPDGSYCRAIASWFTDARAVFPAAPLGHHEWRPLTGERTKVVSQSGWNIPSDIVAQSCNIPGSRNEPDKAAMVADIDTYRVGLIGDTEPEDLSNDGCPAAAPVDDRVRLNDAGDLAGLDTVTITGGPFPGTYSLVKNCNGGDRTELEIQNDLKVAIINSSYGVIELDHLDDDGSVIIVDSLLDRSRPIGDANLFLSGGSLGGRIIAYSEIVAGEDCIKVEGNPAQEFGPTIYATHCHGYDDDRPMPLPPDADDPHHDGIQCRNDLHNLWILYSNIEGPMRNTQNALRCRGTIANYNMSNITLAKTYFSGSSQSPITIGPRDEAEDPIASGFQRAWDNRFLGGDDAHGVSWTSSKACDLQTEGPPDIRASGNLASDGNQTGVSDDVGAWDTNDCNPGQTTITPDDQDDVGDYADVLESYVAQIRAAAGF